jgi:septum site-determining protein MinC
MNSDMMIEAPPSVRIRGVGNSVWVTIVPDTPFATIQAELTRLFKPLNHIGGDARVVLDTGDIGDDDERRRQIVTYMKDSFHLNEIAAPKENNSGEEKRYRMKDSRNTLTQYSNETLVIAGRVRSGQSVHAKKHLVVMGDVNPGCELIAGGDILVIGSLCGTAAAGQPENRDCIILALDFRPTQIKIGDVVAAGLPVKGQGAPEIAHVENGAIIVDDYPANSPFKRIPSPVIR